jgi:hypothetical protein
MRDGHVPHDSLIRLLAATELQENEMRDFLRSLGGSYGIIADPGRKSRLITDDSAHRQILGRLKSANVVSGYKPEKGQLRVNLRRQ